MGFSEVFPGSYGIWINQSSDEFERLWIRRIYGLDHLERLLIFRNLTIHRSPRKNYFRVYIKDEFFSQEGFTMQNFQSLLRVLDRLQLALEILQNIKLCVLDHSMRELPAPVRSLVVSCQTALSPSGDPSVDSYASIAAAAVLLSLVFFYVTGHADRGGSKAYSSGCLDFRDTFIAIILFHGAYVWIKSRDVAPKGVYRREVRDKRGNIRVVFEPRFKPSHRKGEPSQHIYVGQYDTPEEASLVYQITAICNHGQGGVLQLGDGNSLTIPPMTESDRRLTGAAKRKCVGAQARDVYRAFKAERSNAAEPRGLQAVGIHQTNSASSNLAGTTYGGPLPVNPTHNTETISGPCGDEGFLPLSFTNSPNDVFWESDFVSTPEEGDDAGGAQGFTVSSTFQEEVAEFNTQSGMSLSSNNGQDFLRMVVRNQRELIPFLWEELHKRDIEIQQRDIEQQQRDIEHQQLKIQLTEFQNHQCFQPLEQQFPSCQDQLQVMDQAKPTSQASVDHSSDDPLRYFKSP